MKAKACGILLAAALAARAAEPPDTAPVKEKPPPAPEYWIASGGASRGAYQAGVLYALLRQLQDEPPERTSLAGISGTSVGALNATMAALQTCLPPRSLKDVTDNLLWKSWQDLSWNALFPGARTCAEYARVHPELEIQCADPGGVAYGPTDGLLTARAFRTISATVRRVLARSGQPHANPALDESIAPCSMALALSFSAENQARIPVGKRLDVPVPTSRRFTTVKIQCMETVAGGKEEPCEPTQRATTRPRSIRICDLPGPASDTGPERLQLPFIREQDASEPSPPSDAVNGSAAPACRPVSSDEFINVALASAAQPIAFGPVTVTYCGHGCEAVESPGLYCPRGKTLCRGRFLDGGMFDSQPVAGSLTLEEIQRTRNATHVIVSPGKHPSQGDVGQGLRGSAYYLRYISDFLEVANGYELQILQRYGKLDPDAKTIKQIDRENISLTSDLSVYEEGQPWGLILTGYVGFLDVDFRLFDYYQGITSGAAWLVEEGRVGVDQVEQKVGLGQHAGLALVASRTLERLNGAGSSFSKLRSDLACEALVQHADYEAEEPRRRSRGLSDEPLGVRELRSMDRLWDATDAVSGPMLQSTDNPRDPYTLFVETLRRRGPVLRDTSQVARRAPGCQQPLGKPPQPADPKVDDWSFDPNHTRPHVSEFERWRFEQVRLALARGEAIERSEGSGGAAFGLVLAQYAAAISESKWRGELSFGSSTVPDRIAGSTVLAPLARLLVPYSITRDFLTADLDFSWSTLSGAWSTPLPFGRAWTRLTGGPALHRFASADADDRFTAGVFGTLSFESAISVVWPPEMGVRAGYWFGPRHPEGTPWSLGAFVRPFGRLELGFGSLGGFGPGGEPRWYLTLGLADVSGLFYWIAHGLLGGGDAYSGATQAPLVGGRQ